MKGADSPVEEEEGPEIKSNYPFSYRNGKGGLPRCTPPHVRGKQNISIKFTNF